MKRGETGVEATPWERLPRPRKILLVAVVLLPLAFIPIVLRSDARACAVPISAFFGALWAVPRFLAVSRDVRPGLLQLSAEAFSTLVGALLITGHDPEGLRFLAASAAAFPLGFGAVGLLVGRNPRA